MSLVTIRKLFPYAAIALLAAALIYSVSFGTMPRADFTFNNGTEIKTVDPPLATGTPEGRIIDSLFEGLMRRLPDPDSEHQHSRENVAYSAQPGVAERFDLSDDGRVYTFHLRENARWSDGSPVTAHDFHWSWQRMLFPDTASEYAYQLHYVRGAKEYTEATLKFGEPVELEAPDRARPSDPFPRGTIERGTLQEIIAPKLDQQDDSLPKDQLNKRIADRTIYAVSIGNAVRFFARKPEEITFDRGRVEAIRSILPDFEKTVAIEVLDARTLRVTLVNPTPYFPSLTAFYPLYPTQRACVEKHGSPAWTKSQNIVTNGPYQLEYRRIRDRIRLRKNPHYWNAASVSLNTIDALAITSDITALSLYETDVLDWSYNVPATVVPYLKGRPDFYSAPQLSIYYYRVNCTKPPFQDIRVRKALAHAIDRGVICDTVTQAGELPSTSFVPPGYAGYQSPKGADFDVAAARKLLAEAGFPEGKGFPKIEILYNTHETHQVIAEVVQSQWKRNLNIDVELRVVEWGTYLDLQTKLQYSVSRAAWTADYDDPNTFVDMYVTGGANNQTGWSNARYDELVAQAGREANAEKRLALLAEAEEILLEEQPIIPIYSYVSKFLLKPHVRGLVPNTQDFHPLQTISIDRGAAK